MRALAHNIVCEIERVGFRKLFAARDHNRDRTCGHDFLKVFTVVGFDNLDAHLRDDACCQFEEAVGTFHVFAHGADAERGDAVAHTGIDDLAQIIDAGELAVRPDEGLNGHTIGIHADSVLDVHGYRFKAQIILKHAGAGGYAQSDRIGQLGGDACADCAACAHEAVHIGRQLGKKQVQTLQARRAPHKISVVKCEHYGVAALWIENIGHMALHAPIQAVAAL